MLPSPAGRFRMPRAVLAGALLALLTASCGTISSSGPPATPTDFPGLAGRLNVVGIKVGEYVSGDAGCTDADLVPAAISFHAHGLDQPTPVKLYLYIFRDHPAYERHVAQVGPCATSWVTDPASYEELEQSPFVLAGQGPWAPGFEAALRRVLEQAAGTGG